MSSGRLHDGRRAVLCVFALLLLTALLFPRIVYSDFGGAIALIAPADSLVTVTSARVSTWAADTEQAKRADGITTRIAAPFAVYTPQERLAPSVDPYRRLELPGDGEREALKNALRARVPPAIPALIAHPAVYAALLLAGLAFPPAYRGSWPRGAMTVMGLVGAAPFILDVALADIWKHSELLFAGQHVFVAKNLAQHGLYGWNFAEMVAYGIPAEAARSWGVGSEPVRSAWTYPGFTVLLAAVYAALGLLREFSTNELTLIAIALGALLVLGGLIFFFFATARLTGDAVIGFAAVLLLSLSGWPWTLCQFPTSEPLQFFMNCVSLWILGRAMSAGKLRFAEIAALGLLAGYGHLVKPYFGALIPVLVLALVAWRFGLSGLAPRRVALAICLALIVAPTLAWGCRNYLVFGEWVFMTSAGGFFLAQGLDPLMLVPTRYGSSEFEFGRNCYALASDQLSRIWTDPTYRAAVLSYKLDLSLAGFTGLNIVGEVGRGPHAGADLLPTGIIAAAFGAFLTAAFYKLPSRLEVLTLGATMIVIAALLFLTQPLARYYLPFNMLYPLGLAMIVSDVAREGPASRAASFGLAGVAIAFFGAILLFDLDRGWLQL